MTDDETLVAELREAKTNYELACEFVIPVTWAQQALLVAMIARAADRIEALETELAEERRQTQRVQTVAATNLDQLQRERARRKVAISARDASRLLRKVTEQQCDALQAELEARLNGPTAEAYRLERDAAAERARVSAEIVKTLQAERDSYAAVIAEALTLHQPTERDDGLGGYLCDGCESRWENCPTRRILSAVPSDTLREHDERVWAEGADAQYGTTDRLRDDSEKNPYRRIEGSKTDA